MTRSKSGLSHKVRRTTIKGSGALSSELVGHAGISQQKEEGQKRLQDALSGLGGHTQKKIREMQMDAVGFDVAGPDPFPDPSYIALQDAGAAMDVDEGTEDNDAVVHALRDLMDHPSRKYRDTRSWADRLARASQNWSQIMEPLVSAYLEWRYRNKEGRDNTQPQSITPASPPPTLAVPDLQSPRETVPDIQSPISCTPPPGRSEVDSAEPDSSDPMPRETAFDIVRVEIIDVHTRDATLYIEHVSTDLTAILLAKRGYMLTAPIGPTIAIAFETLEFFRVLRLRKPSFSVEGFAKVICDVYSYPYRRRYRTALNDAFDVYMKIHRAIDSRVLKALGRDSPNWRVLNSCPACCYECADEPQLIWRRIFAFDGNNSLKRIAKIGDRQIADMREFTSSDYYLPADFVDMFKDEVKRHAAPRYDVGTSLDSEDEWEDVNDKDEHQGMPIDVATSDDPMVECTRNWKSAASEDKKRMWGIFDESGIFAAACRHGFILWLIDMVRSGELAKYPLAIVAKALRILGDKLLIGYDISCTFGTTISNSSLGEEFKRLGCRCCVNAFHGYSHSHLCQTQHHPTVIPGAGLEDLETLERIFSQSNQLAGVTRYASRYHRRVLIDAFFQQWDWDKYTNLATMLLNNYRQALKTIDDNMIEVERGTALLGCTEDTLAEWQRQEAQYFANFKRHREFDSAVVAYVTLLQKWYSLEDRSSSTMSAFVMSMPANYLYSGGESVAAGSSSTTYEAEVSRTRKLETEHRLLAEQRDSALRDVIAMELHLGIKRWTPGSKEYQETLQYIAERNYCDALDKLQQLVVQRLFELHTLNISQTGKFSNRHCYKVRTHIAKSLTRRSKAIRNAVNAYNRAAAALPTPRPPLDWSKVSHYSFLDEFELLRDTRNDARKEPWANPTAREVMKKERAIRRAREEIIRCNVEVHHLHTWILDENAQLDIAIRALEESGDIIVGAVAAYSLRRKRVNARLLATISQIYALEGYSGKCAPGVRKGGSPLTSSPATDDHLAAETEELALDDQDDTPDEGDLVEADRVLEFATSLV